MPRYRILALFVFLTVSMAARAQSAAAGALEGSVADTAGQRVAGAKVTLLNASTGERLEAESDAGGAFRFALAPPGPTGPRLRARASRRRRWRQLTLNASEVAVLTPCSSRATRRPLPNASASFARRRLRRARWWIRRRSPPVPLNTRNFTQVLSMSSGSVASVNNAGTLGRGTPSVNVNGNTTAGGYTVDGA